MTLLSLGKPSSMALKMFFNHAWMDKAGAVQYEVYESRFGNDGDLYHRAKYFIISHDRRV